MRLPFLCEKSGAIALALPGLTAGSQEDEIVLIFLKLYTERNIIGIIQEIYKTP